QAAHVRESVVLATQAVQTAALSELRAALQAHSNSLRDTVSLNAGPIRALREDILSGVSQQRQEVLAELARVRELVVAAQATAAAPRPTRAAGTQVESEIVQ